MDEKNILIKICELITENDPDVLAEVEELNFVRCT